MFRVTALPRSRCAGAVLLALAATLCTSCSRDLPRSRLVAVYQAEHENGTEILTLDNDGWYKHQFKGTDGKDVTSTGKWEIAKVVSNQRILVHDFTPHFPGGSHIASTWPLEPREDYGLIRLYLSQQPRQFYLELPKKK